jgi:hypothetical protein
MPYTRLDRSNIIGNDQPEGTDKQPAYFRVRREGIMAGHIDVRVKVSAPLAVTWQITAEAEMPGNPAMTEGRHSPGHDVISSDPGNNRITFHITTAPDSNGNAWSYYIERTTDVASQTAYARRWGNEHFAYSCAFWQYTGSDSGSEIRCVADFEMTAGSPMSDRDMEAFMERGTRAAMESSARAAEAAAARIAAATTSAGAE